MQHLPHPLKEIIFCYAVDFLELTDDIIDTLSLPSLNCYKKRIQNLLQQNDFISNDDLKVICSSVNSIVQRNDKSSIFDDKIFERIYNSKLINEEFLMKIKIYLNFFKKRTIYQFEKWNDFEYFLPGGEFSRIDPSFLFTKSNFYDAFQLCLFKNEFEYANNIKKFVKENF